MRALFARHRVGVYRWLLRLVLDEGVAEDLLSEVFFDVWRRAASFVRWHQLGDRLSCECAALHTKIKSLASIDEPIAD
jgi:hypothetical protein